MKFVVDAQLPLTLARQLTAAGHEAVHTSELAQGNRTPDTVLAAFADEHLRRYAHRGEAPAFLKHRLVVSQAPGAVEHLQVDNGASSDQPLVHQGPKPRPDGR